MNQTDVTPCGEESQGYSLGRRVLAWGVHAFTMTGVLWALLAALAVFDGSIRLMWLWLGCALLVDGLDGSMARKVGVKKVIRWFDGTVLDYIVDYLTWTFVPVLFLYLHIPLGPKWLATILCVVVLASSMFCYCNEYEKSGDHYFVGFPAAWNIVAFYFWVLQSPSWFNICTTIVLVILTLVPTAYLHPFRVQKLMWVNILSVVAWFAGAIGFVATAPERQLWEWICFGVGSAWFVFISTWRSICGSDRYGLPAPTKIRVERNS